MRKFRWVPYVVFVIGICAGFAGTVFSSMAYMAKDYYAYNYVYAFFGVSTQFQVSLTRLPIEKIVLLQILNLSHMMFVLSSVLFALLFTSLLNHRLMKAIRWGVGTFAAVQLVFLDPQLIRWVYMQGIGPFQNVFFFREFYRILPAVSRWANITEILFATGLLLATFFRTPRSLRASVGLVAFFYSAISLVYLYLYSWLPAQTMWMSRAARYISFGSLPVYKPTFFNTYSSLISGMLVCSFFLVALYYLWKITSARRSDLAFRSKVSAVDTVSRIFCHYLKNELLSQQAELKLLSAKVDPALQTDVAYIISRNDEIYQRLSAVRDAMRQKKMTMERLEIVSLVRDTFDRIALPENVHLSEQLPEEPVYVEGNPYQLQEVLECLVRNALEAMENNAAPPRIKLQVLLLQRYVSINIGNNGTPIARKQWNAIFDPFYTTKSTKSNWGLGLALCRNVVSLHRGRIWVDEEPERGEMMTVFHIVLRNAD